MNGTASSTGSLLPRLLCCETLELFLEVPQTNLPVDINQGKDYDVPALSNVLTESDVLKSVRS